MRENRESLIRPIDFPYRQTPTIGRSLAVACNPRWVDAKFVLTEKGMIDRIWAEAFAEEWIAGWNAHDLERVLAHYTEDFEMTSPLIVQRMGVANGKLKGKEPVRSYWGQGLAATPQRIWAYLELAGESIPLCRRPSRANSGAQQNKPQRLKPATS